MRINTLGQLAKHLKKRKRTFNFVLLTFSKSLKLTKTCFEKQKENTCLIHCYSKSLWNKKKKKRILLKFLRSSTSHEFLNLLKKPMISRSKNSKIMPIQLCDKDQCSFQSRFHVILMISSLTSTSSQSQYLNTRCLNTKSLTIKTSWNI